MQGGLEAQQEERDTAEEAGLEPEDTSCRSRDEAMAQGTFCFWTPILATLGLALWPPRTAFLMLAAPLALHP